MVEIYTSIPTNTVQHTGGSPDTTWEPTRIPRGYPEPQGTPADAVRPRRGGVHDL